MWARMPVLSGIFVLTRHRVKEFAPTEDEKWVQEFEQHLSSQHSLSSVAKEMVDTVTDPEIKATEVWGFS